MTALIEKRGRARGVEHSGIVIHSLISAVSACGLYFLCVSVICWFNDFIFFYPTPAKKAHVTVCVWVSFALGEARNLGLFLKMQIGSICGLLLSVSG